MFDRRDNLTEASAGAQRIRMRFECVRRGTPVALLGDMPITSTPHTALLPWLAALTGAVAVHLFTPVVPDARPAQVVVVACRRECESPKVHVEVEHPVGTYEYVLDRAALDRLRVERAQQRVRPSAEGFRLGHVRRGSLFHELGFMTGDLVVSIDGGDATRFHVLRGRARHPIDIVVRAA